MSWFDTSQLASMASKAMKEAQKTFDKALDIDDETGEGETKQEEEVDGDSSWSSSWNKLLTKSESDVPPENADATASLPAATTAATKPSSSSNSSSRKRSSLWSSISEAATLMTTAASEENSPDEEPAKAAFEPVFSQPQSDVSALPGIGNSSSLPDSGRLTQPAAPEAGGQASCELDIEDNLDQEELLRDSMEEGFSRARLVVTPDSGDEQQLSHSAVNPSRHETKSSSDCDPSLSNLYSYNSVISYQRPASSGQSDLRDTDRTELPDSGSSRVESASEDSGSFGPPESGSLSYDHIQSSASSSNNKESGSGSSIDVISPSSIEQISCSSIDVIPSSTDKDTHEESSPGSEGLCDSDLLNVDKVEVLADPTQQEEATGVTSMNLSGASNTTIVARLESDQVECVQNMLSDALLEQEGKSGDGSISSRSSDIVKIDCVSETSTEDLENQIFTSSSDVDVISSPKQERCAVKKTKEAEEFENMLSQLNSYQQEITDLRKRNEELSNTVKAREDKILSVSREISLSHEGSSQLVDRLETAVKQVDKLREQSENKQLLVHSLEKELKTERKSRAALEKQVKKMESQLSEINNNADKKDSLVSDLRQEGEALARQNGKQADIIRKLRAKEKTSDSERNLLSDQLQQITAEHDKLSKSLAEKTENESSISKSVKTLAERNKVLENENRSLSRELEQNKEKNISLRSSLDSANKNIAQMKEEISKAKSVAHSEAAQSESKLRQQAEHLLQETEVAREADRSEYEARIASCQEALMRAEKTANQREEQLRRELREARCNLEKTENRYEELNIDLEGATKPLLRQIQSLQQELSKLRRSSEESERCLSDRIKSLTAAINMAKEKERRALDQYEQSSSRLAVLEATINTSHGNRNELEAKVTHLETKLDETETNIKIEKDANKRLQQENIEQQEIMTKERDLLKLRLETVMSECDSRKRICEDLAQQVKDQEERLRDLQTDTEVRGSLLRPGSSGPQSLTPSPSYHLSLHQQDSNNRETWADDLLSPSCTSLPVTTLTPGITSLYDTMKHGNSAAYLESLESQLKIKDGEVAGLHQQILQLDRTKQSLSSQLADLTSSLEDKEARLQDLSTVKSQLETVTESKENLEKSLREKDEELQDMRQDLAYVKEKYRNQIDQLLAGTA